VGFSPVSLRPLVVMDRPLGPVLRGDSYRGPIRGGAVGPADVPDEPLSPDFSGFTEPRPGL